MADLGRIRTEAAMTAELPPKGLGRNSFRAKFILVVGGAVLFDLLLSGGLALWNVRQLSQDATKEVGHGLERANQDYILSYAASTANEANLILAEVDSDVRSLATFMQGQTDSSERETIGAAVAREHPGAAHVVYDTVGKWSQNMPGALSVVSVWGYLLGGDHRPLPQVAAEIESSASFDLVAKSFLENGPPKLQIYFIGPKERPIFRTAPYTDQAQTFDRLYPGHNQQNFWDFFFPKLYEVWEAWITDPSQRPIADNITRTAPYTDAITGKLIVSFFYPIWTKNRDGVAGAVGADITLDQLAGIVEGIKIGDSGFGFLSTSTGNVVAINPMGEAKIGLSSASGGNSQGVTAVDRSLKNSSQPAIATIDLQQDGIMHRILLNDGGEEVPYLMVTKKLLPNNSWGPEGVTKEVMSVGVVVPEREIYASLFSAQQEISNATNRIVIIQIAAILVSLAIVTIAVLAASKRVTGGIVALAGAARRIQKGDYSVRVDISSRDEVAEASVAFNQMAEQIQFTTENLENLVEDRTREIEAAKTEITTLNAKLSLENKRLGAELAVAQKIQLMVLPRSKELSTVDDLEISAFMRPAEEVGGDYYDVLSDGVRLKVGIGDVTGHGLESGVLMLMVQSIARGLQEAGETDPGRFLSNLNRAIYKNIERTETDKHLTLAFLDYEGGKMAISGQHEELIVVRRDGRLERIDTIDLGFPVGLEADIAQFINTRSFEFDPGDLVLLHTDGVTEAENIDGELYGIERLCRAAQKMHTDSADNIVNGIVAELDAYIGAQRVHDDITLLALKRR